VPHISQRYGIANIRSAKKRRIRWLAKKQPDGREYRWNEIPRILPHIFPVILAGVVIGFMLAYGLMSAASFRHPWTWILPIIGLAIFDGIIWFFYRETPTFGHILRFIHRKSDK
jgi:hypothetical protein